MNKSAVTFPSPSAPSGATLEDIAQAAGVSPRTVSNALNNVGKGLRVDAIKRAENIRKIAADLGYRPNGAARAFSRGTFNAVALLQSTDRHRSFTHPSLLDAVQKVLDQNDLHLTLCRLPDHKLTSHGVVPKLLREYMADGMLINYTDRIPAKMVDLIESFGLPAIWMNTPRDHDAVYFDERAAGRLAVEQVAALGHRSVAYLDVSHHEANLASDHYSARERFIGCHGAAAELGLDLGCYFREHILPDSVADRDQDQADMVRFMKSLLQRDDRPTAVISQTTWPATALAFAAAELGLTPGRDLSILAFAHDRDRSLGADLPTIHLPFALLGHTAIRMLQERIAQPEQAIASQVIAPEFRPSPLLGRVHL
ncbi:MAG: LacI family DNA-binding transcriptional regulator [Planctomycetota bacterium]